MLDPQYCLKDSTLQFVDIKTVDDFSNEAMPTPPIASSFKLIDLLKSLSEIQEQYCSKKSEVELRQEIVNNSDLFDKATLERKAKELEAIRDHLNSILKSKGGLLSRLQFPLTPTYIVLEPEYQKELQQALQWMSKSIDDISKLLTTISWLNTFNWENTNAQLQLNVFGQLASFMAQYQRFHESLQAMTNCLKQLQSCDTRQK